MKKKLQFLSRTSVIIISGLIFFKIRSRKNFQFFAQNHGLTPSEKFDFWDLKNDYFYDIKKLCFFPEHHSALFLPVFKTQCRKGKTEIFDKNHGLTPLKTADFLDFKKWSRKTSLLRRTSIIVISGLIFLKTR